jgi:hypothetical protein
MPPSDGLLDYPRTDSRQVRGFDIFQVKLQRFCKSKRVMLDLSHSV